jgi:hypothetical protein
MVRGKPVPRNEKLSFNRAEKISRNSPAVKDDVKNLSIGLMDMDSAIMYYFNNVIKPKVEVNEEVVDVPCIYGSNEKWNQISKQGYLRDKKRQIIVPLIVFQRTSMEKNTNMSIDKLDANNPNLFYSFERKNTNHNRFDKFDILQGTKPGKEFYNVVMPDYVKLTYEFTVWTSYIDQMNKIIEKVNYSDGAYWGEPGKMKFKSEINTFEDSTELDNEKIIKTKFSVVLNGYILPEHFNNKTTTQKYYTPKKIIIREQTDKKLEDIINK